MRIGFCLLMLVSVMLPADLFAEESVRITPVVKVVKEWSPSVVNISTEQVVRLQTHPLWSQLGGIPDAQNVQQVGTMKLNSVGSGVIISKDGLILTNAHVVQVASKIYVMLNDGKQAEAVIEAMSQPDDLALIRINPPEELKPVKLADDVIMGESVITIGNPLGLDNSVSAGIISGLNRNIMSGKTPVLTGLIQTDASINPGSSGGALFNLDGELVGICLAVVQGANSIGVAIPYDRIKKVLKDYREGKLAIKKEAAPEPAKGGRNVMNKITIPVQ